MPLFNKFELCFVIKRGILYKCMYKMSSYICDVQRGESMRGIRFKKSRICLRVILLILICIPFLSFFLNIGNASMMQDSQTADIEQGSISSNGAGKVHQNPQVDSCIQQASFCQETQRSFNSKNNNCMTAFCGSADGLFVCKTASLISLSGQIPVSKIKYFLIAPHCPHAPPYALA